MGRGGGARRHLGAANSSRRKGNAFLRVPAWPAVWQTVAFGFGEGLDVCVDAGL